MDWVAPQVTLDNAEEGLSAGIPFPGSFLVLMGILGALNFSRISPEDRRGSLHKPAD